MSEDQDLIRSTIAKSMAVGGELMRQAVIRVLEEEFANMTDGVDMKASMRRVYERIKGIPLP